jgi:hypothetical protein
MRYSGRWNKAVLKMAIGGQDNLILGAAKRLAVGWREFKSTCPRLSENRKLKLTIGIPLSLTAEPVLDLVRHSPRKESRYSTTGTPPKRKSLRSARLEVKRSLVYNT